MIDADRTSISLTASLDTRIDTHAFGIACTVGQLDEAVRLYGGDFIDGLLVAGCPAFEEWAFFRREALRSRLVQALERVIERELARGEPRSAIAAAGRLLEREVSGEGQWVTTSLLQAQIFMLDFQAARWLQAQEVSKQAGNNHPTSIPTGVFKSSDGYINTASAGRVMWERLFNAIEAPELIEHPDFETGALRSKNRDAVNVTIEARTVKKSSADWIAIFNKIGLPSGPIYNIDQVFAHEQVKHLGIAQDAVKPNGETQTFVGQPFALSRTPSKIVATPPDVGEHTDEVLKEFGSADNEIAEVHAVKAVQRAACRTEDERDGRQHIASHRRQRRPPGLRQSGTAQCGCRRIWSRPLQKVIRIAGRPRGRYRKFPASTHSKLLRIVA